jgi:hypothetical protein
MDLPLTLIISYAAFSFFLFYQQLHLKNYQGASEILGAALSILALAGMVYGLGFLIYWGYKVSWLQAGILFALAFAIKLVWFPIEAKLGLRNSYWVFSLIGFVVLPASGYFMWSSLP